MMYYCNDCGSITEGECIHECVLPEVPGEQPPCYDDYMVCSECGSTQIDEAYKCVLCGQYYDWDGCDLCEDCQTEIFEGFYHLMTDQEEKYPHARRSDILDGMCNVFDIFFDKYRYRRDEHGK